MNANANYRDERGKFLKGCPGGPGNPLAPKVTALKTALLDAVKPDDVSAAVRRLLELVHDDDPKTALDAMRLLFDRVYGRPKESVEMEVQREPPPTAVPMVDLNPDEIEVLRRIRDKLSSRRE
jgi:hypothetical protein